MSRVGLKPIIIPSGVDVNINEGSVIVKGPKGQIATNIHPLVNVSQESFEDQPAVIVSVKNADQKQERSLWGTTRTLIDNMVIGVYYTILW